jgi:hypothetical protein
MLEHVTEMFKTGKKKITTDALDGIYSEIWRTARTVEFSLQGKTECKIKQRREKLMLLHTWQ